MPEPDFGVVVAAHPRDLAFARGCCASIRHFLGEVPICVLVDGRYRRRDFGDAYGVQVVNRDEVADPDLRRASFGWGLTKMVAFWESPWETFLVLDADTVVWGDVLHYADFDEADIVVDRHLYRLGAVNGTNPYLADFLPGVEGREEVRRRLSRLLREWFFDPDELERWLPSFDWQRHVYDYFCSGAFFGRRGSISLDDYLHALDLARSRPGLFGPGEMGLLNYLVFAAADEGRLRVRHRAELQTLACQHSGDELRARFPLKALEATAPAGEATVVHWSGRPKPTRAHPEVHPELMSWFRAKFARDARTRAAASPDVDVPFAHVLDPTVRVARARLDAELDPAQRALLAEPAWRSLERHLLETLSELAAPCLMEVFAATMPAGRRLLGLLAPEASPDGSDRRYLEFARAQRAGGLGNLWRTYPVLARAAGSAVERWVDATADFVRHLGEDADELRELRGGGRVVAVRPGLSDPHHGGRSVIGVAFDSGVELVYKPRSLAVDRAYADLLSWLKERGAPVALRTPAVLDRGDHGWVEHVAPSGCATREEAADYYVCVGALLCLLYVLGASDCHHDNLVAAGSHPVLVDLETLLQPEGLVREGSESDGAESPFWSSVMRTGLLPRWELVEGSPHAVDMSALGGIEPQATAWRRTAWRAVNTDAMHAARVPSVLAAGTSTPTVAGVVARPEDHVEDVVRGFADTYRFLSHHRSELLAGNGPLETFRGCTTRVLLRPTSLYYGVLADASTPAALRSDAAHVAELDALARAHRKAPVRGSAAILDAEVASLAAGDIPHFSARADATDLLAGGRRLVRGCYRVSGLEAAAARVRTLGDDDLGRQVALIRGAIHARAARPGAREAPDGAPPAGAELDPMADVLHIARDIESSALRGADGSASWAVLEYRPDTGRYQLGPAGPSLYDGAGGIALFLAALFSVHGGDEWRRLALDGLKPVRDFVRTRPVLGVGGMAGLGSVVYVLTRASRLLDEPALLDDAGLAAAAITAPAVAADRELDVVSGAAGALLGLLALHEESGDAALLEQANACGRHLLASRMRGATKARAWRSAGEDAPLTGFSHGAAGIAYALARLYALTGRRELLAAAREGIAYERELFDAEAGNWPDLRRSARAAFGVSWCHGAPGVGLGRIGCLAAIDLPELSHEIEAAAAFVRGELLDVDQVCCGNLGRLEALRAAGEALSRPDLVDDAERLTSALHERARTDGGYRLFGNLPAGVANPAFFQGSAGIGYQLLRRLHPDRLPSVLLLA